MGPGDCNCHNALTTDDHCAFIGQGESVATVENQPVDDPQTGKFTWTIENFSKINLRKHYSESFTVGGYKWCAYLFLITLLGAHISAQSCVKGVLMWCSG